MPRYLLNCECGQNLPVDMGQAGGQVVCQCGRTLSVPALRRLRELPTETAAVEANTRGAWQPRYGVVAALLILAAVPGVASLWLHLQEPKPPKFDAAQAQKRLDEQMADVTPSMAWQWWLNNHSQLEQGFEVYTFHMSPVNEAKRKDNRFMKNVLLVVSSAAVLAAVLAALWPSASAMPPRAR